MKDIKFRAWINIEEWQGYYCQGDSNEYIQFLLFQDGFSIVDYNDEYLKDSEFVIEQYTGLKDKNGIEIYEGDVVACLWESAEGFVSTHKGTIVYDSMNCNFYSHSLGQEFSRSLSSNINDSVEVIGNNNENKELL